MAIVCLGTKNLPPQQFIVCLVENYPPGKEIAPDEFYSNTDFSLDMFLALKGVARKFILKSKLWLDA